MTNQISVIKKRSPVREVEKGSSKLELAGRVIILLLTVFIIVEGLIAVVRG